MILLECDKNFTKVIFGNKLIFKETNNIILYIVYKFLTKLNSLLTWKMQKR